MAKQYSLLIIAIGLFVLIWVLVIIQLTDQQNELWQISYEETELHQQSSNLKEDQVIDQDSLTSNIQSEQSEEETSYVKEINEIGLKTETKERMINLRDYDFSEISTPAGVSIEDILDRIHIPD